MVFATQPMSMPAMTGPALGDSLEGTRQRAFLTATASLPPAETEVIAPAIRFESASAPLESQRHDVLLMKSVCPASSPPRDTTLKEAVQSQDLPVVVEQQFIDQATELVRLTTLLAVPKWTIHKFPQQPASSCVHQCRRPDDSSQPGWDHQAQRSTTARIARDSSWR